MNKNTNISSIEYYLPKVRNTGKKSSLIQKKSKKSNYSVLIQDHIEDSIYLIDA